MDWLHRVKLIVRRSTISEAATKPFSAAREKRSKQNGRKVQVGVQRSMGIVMMAVLAIAAVVEVAILIAEIATRARLVARSFSSGRTVS